MKQGRVLSLALIGGGVIWVALLLVSWGVRPLHDSMVVGKTSDEKNVTQTVTCSSPLESGSVDADAVPALDSPFEYPHTPCERAHAESRRLLVLNLVIGVALVVAGIVVLIRNGRSRGPQGAEPASHAA